MQSFTRLWWIRDSPAGGSLRRELHAYLVVLFHTGLHIESSIEGYWLKTLTMERFTTFGTIGANRWQLLLLHRAKIRRRLQSRTLLAGARWSTQHQEIEVYTNILIFQYICGFIWELCDAAERLTAHKRTLLISAHGPYFIGRSYRRDNVDFQFWWVKCYNHRWWRLRSRLILSRKLECPFGIIIWKKAVEKGLEIWYSR